MGNSIKSFILMSLKPVYNFARSLLKPFQDVVYRKVAIMDYLNVDKSELDCLMQRRLAERGKM